MSWRFMKAAFDVFKIKIKFVFGLLMSYFRRSLCEFHPRFFAFFIAVIAFKSFIDCAKTKTWMSRNQIFCKFENVAGFLYDPNV